MKVFYTYLWLREDGTPYYVGKGKGQRAFTKSTHRFNPPITDRILIQEFPDEKSAFFAEKFLISFYGRVDLGTGRLRNMSDGGEGLSGWSEETRKKIHEAMVGHKRNLGKKYSAERKHKISVALSGRVLSLEHRRKMSVAHKGKKNGHKISEETRRKMNAARWPADRKTVA